jgi:hypothetical protein
VALGNVFHLRRWVSQQRLGFPNLLLIELELGLASTLSATGAGGTQPRQSSLADQIAFELGQGSVSETMSAIFLTTASPMATRVRQ